jgi:hypothetical protein
MANNINQIKPLLTFENTGDDFYFIQVLKRRKENPELTSNAITVKNFYIFSIEELENSIEEIKALCEQENARAYVRLNVRSLKKTLTQLVKELVIQIAQGNSDNWRAVEIMADYMGEGFHKELMDLCVGAMGIKKEFASAAGQTSNAGKSKTWVVDVDSTDGDYLLRVSSYIEELQSQIPKSKYKIVGTFATKNGVHIISEPFNLQEFKKKFPEIDVHKDAPTLLYFS